MLNQIIQTQRAIITPQYFSAQFDIYTIQILYIYKQHLTFSNMIVTRQGCLQESYWAARHPVMRLYGTRWSVRYISRKMHASPGSWKRVLKNSLWWKQCIANRVTMCWFLRATPFHASHFMGDDEEVRVNFGHFLFPVLCWGEKSIGLGERKPLLEFSAEKGMSARRCTSLFRLPTLP